MASKRQRGTSWEYVVKKAGVLDKPLYLTFDTEEEGDAHIKKLEALLDRGIVPTEHQTTNRVETISSLATLYLRDAPVKDKDRGILETVIKDVGKTMLTAINAHWVDNWITGMKREKKLAPATIRGKVGALARCTDWGMRRGYLLMPDHPLRTLPDGYAQYTETDEALAGEKRVDVERDRRLERGELDRIMATIDSGVLPRSQRPYVLEHRPALKVMLTLAVESAMRMRELYTLTLDQVDLPRRTVFLDKTKNGDKRQVPLSSVAVSTLQDYLKVREIPGRNPENALFPWWDGRTQTRGRNGLAALSDFLSKLYISIFETAGCVDLKFHDMRHEATSRLFERTTLSETEIMKITGHKSHRMMMRYANLRGSVLAEKLW